MKTGIYDDGTGEFDYYLDDDLLLRLKQTRNYLKVYNNRATRTPIEIGRDLIKCWGSMVPVDSRKSVFSFAGLYFNNVVVDISGVEYRGYVDISDAGKRLFEGFYQAMLEDKWREKFSARLL